MLLQDLISLDDLIEIEKKITPALTKYGNNLDYSQIDCINAITKIIRNIEIEEMIGVVVLKKKDSNIKIEGQK